MRALLGVLLASGCALLTMRPEQEYANAQAALAAAERAQAEKYAPASIRLAKEWMVLAERSYQLKEFKTAKSYLEQARKAAEFAEFAALIESAKRPEEAQAEPPALPESPPPPQDQAPPSTLTPSPEASVSPSNPPSLPLEPGAPPTDAPPPFTPPPEASR